MTAVDYAVVSNIITDDVILPDGTEHRNLLGGAATYAAAGARVWSPSVGVVSGVGADFETLHGAWFRQAGIDMTGLSVRDPHTPHSWVRYFEDGEREETPQFGAAHFQRMVVAPADIPTDYWQARGLYIFRDADRSFWREIFSASRSGSPRILWELRGDAASPAHWEDVQWVLGQVEMFSLNLTEGRLLCGLTGPHAILQRLLETGVRVVALRMGADGVLVADGSGVWHVPPVPDIDVVDVTGAGNAFCGGFLVGYCETGEAGTAGAFGNVAASFMLEQYGPPDFDSRITEAAHERLGRISPVKVTLSNAPQ